MLAARTLLQNRYTIVRLLSRGGVGAVYEAHDSRLKRQVAIKHLLLIDPQAIKAFAHEAQLLGMLQHAYLPRVSDHFSEGTDQFLVMDYIPGDDLGVQIQRRGQAFPVGQVLVWADQLLDALDYLHTHQPPILHRDIKPHNLKVTARGNLMLLDFGLAKGSIATTLLTTTNSVRGYTPLYAPLEQIQGTGTSVQSDLYGAAATLYHLLVGMPAPDVLTRVAATINGQPDPLMPVYQVNPQISSTVSAVLGQALSVSFAQRPKSAAVMRYALQTPSALAAGRTTVISPSQIVPTIVPVSSHKRWYRRWWMTGVVLVILLVIGGLVAWMSIPSHGTLPTEIALASPSPLVSTLTRVAAPLPTVSMLLTSTRNDSIATLAPTTQPTATDEPSITLLPLSPVAPLPVVVNRGATSTAPIPTATDQPPTTTSIPPTITALPFTPTMPPIPPTNTPVPITYWSGVTDQGRSFSFYMEPIDGQLTITWMKYEYEYVCPSTGGRGSESLARTLRIPVQNGTFAYDDGLAIISGQIFEGSGNGRIRDVRGQPACDLETLIGWSVSRQ